MDSVIRRVVTVAGGPYAPGHIGELTQIVPFEMVDAALAETNSVQRRLRALPSRVVVYLLLAGALFAELGYGQVWARMCAGLGGLEVACPTPSALAAAWGRIGVAPFQGLHSSGASERAHREVAGIELVARHAAGLPVGEVLGHDDVPGGLSWVATTRLPDSIRELPLTDPAGAEAGRRLVEALQALEARQRPR